MPLYPSTKNESRIDHRQLRSTVTAIFEKCGLNRNDAHLVARHLVDADLRGCHSHGVIRVPDYIAKLREEGVNPAGRPFVVKSNQGAIVVDAANSMGQVACNFAMQLAIDRARASSIAMVCVQGSNHCGALADYTMLAAQEDMIGIAGTNALPTMAPFGGIDKILGINPISIAIPSAKHPDIVFDAAFSASSHGKIRVYDQKGVAIPSTWAFNRDGMPTTDARDGLDGLLQPIGGYKGTGLALIVGLLSTMLTSASYGTDLGNMVDGPRAGHDGHFCLVVDIAAFIDPNLFKEKVDAIIDQIRTSRRAPKIERIYLPGELEADTAESYKREGILLNEVTIAHVMQSAERMGLEISRDHLIAADA